MFVLDQSAAQHTLDRVVHAHTSLEGTKCPEANVFVVGFQADCKSQRAHCANETTQFGVEREGGVDGSCGSSRKRVSDDGGVKDGAKHHGDHK
jgi:hypothetical protein